MKLTGVLVSVSIILFSACGGGGGGSSSGSSGVITSPGVFSSASIFNADVLTVTLAESSDDIYVGGEFTAYNGTSSSRVIRLNSDGSIDAGFAVGTGFNNIVRSIAVATDGSGDIYVGGDFSAYNGTNSSRIIRLNSDGSIDAGFNVGTGFDGRVRSIVVATDGSGDIYAGGEFDVYNATNSSRVIRLNSDGSIDAGFDVGTGFDNSITSIAIATDGSGDIYTGGSFTSYRGNARNRIARVNRDGSNDAGFDVGAGFDSVVTSIAVATDGSGDIFAGGFFTSYRGNARNRIARINSDSSNDAGFNVGTGFDRAVNSIVVATDGSGAIFVAGFFTSYRGDVRNQIVRIHSDGANDANFNVGTGFNGAARSIAVARDGSGDLFSGGSFTSYNGTDVGYLGRLDSVGQLR